MISVFLLLGSQLILGLCQRAGFGFINALFQIKPSANFGRRTSLCSVL